MSTTTAGILFLVSLIVALVAVHVPLGDYMYRVFTGTGHTRAEKLIYRLIGVRPDVEQTWGVYARGVLAFSAVSILFLYGLQRVQNHLLLSLGFKPVMTHQAWNTAISFTTNTNWQSYSGESTMGYLVQMAGLAVQNFVSAAVGIAVAIALVRGFARKRTEHLGTRSSYAYQLEAFAAAVRGGPSLPLDADDAVANMRLIDRCYEAAGLPPRPRSAGRRSAPLG